MEFDKVKADWKKRGFSCELWTDTPGAAWEDFIHETDELVLLLEGDVELEIKGRKTRLEPGREERIPAQTLHSVRNKGRTVSKWLYGYKQRESSR